MQKFQAVILLSLTIFLLNSCGEDPIVSTVGDLTPTPVVPPTTNGNDSDGDGVADNLDAFPEDSSESVDSDGDGLGNNEDLNDDNDEYLDLQDLDRDGDGLIEIFNANMLNAIRYNLAGTSYKKTNSSTGDTTGCPPTGCIGYELGGNIDLSSFESWIPIGGKREPYSGSNASPEKFTGRFDGSNNAIANLRIESNSNWIGLFARLESSITNLVLENSSITSLATSGDIRIGAIVAVAEEDSLIDNVSVRNVSISSSSTRDTVGGLVGYLSEGSITNSTTEVTISSGDRNDIVGGLVGLSYGVITRSASSATITGGDGEDSIGGLVGSNSDARIEDSYAYASSVSGENNNDFVGGLVGYSDINSYISASYSVEMSVFGGSGNDYVGGLVGRSFARIVNGDPVIENSYNKNTTTTGNDGRDFIGGLVGWLQDGNTEGNYSTGDTFGGIGDDAVGGLIGWQQNGTIEDSYTTGNTYGNEDVDQVGGLIGVFQNTNSEDSVLDSYTTGVVSGGLGNDDVGGIVGKNDVIIEGSSAKGVISGGQGDDNVGGIVGLNQGSVYYSYYIGYIYGSAGNDNVGGLIGFNEAESFNNQKIESNFVDCSVEGGAGNDNVGGIIGRSRKLSGNKPLVDAVYTKGRILGSDGNDTMGGIVGLSSSTRIKDSYVFSLIDGGKEEDRLGLIVGFYAFTDIANSFFVGPISRIKVITPEESAGLELDLGQLIEQATIMGYTLDDNPWKNVTNTWDFGSSTQLPILRRGRDLLPEQTR